ncbi:MAG: ABC transporter permease [Coriobacteriales bacterium]|jgi:ABC-2 type transport system permease protein|nr:ABC transporter permease [Coriobacteriales bacterium]
MKTTLILFGRTMKHIFRSPDTIITVAIMPIAIMLMFVYVFGGAVKANMAEGVNYVNYQLPGILLMTVGSAVAYTAFRLFSDVQKGICDRFHSMPISRIALLWAHVLTSLVSIAITFVIIFLVALLMGFRSEAGFVSWLAIAGILMLFALALTWLAVIAGLVAKTMEGATAFSYPLIFLPMLSSAFVPTDTMPALVRAFAENQPVSPIVDALRNLLSGNAIGSEIYVALAWCVCIAAAAYAVAMFVYRRRATKR